MRSWLKESASDGSATTHGLPGVRRSRSKWAPIMLLAISEEDAAQQLSRLAGSAGVLSEIVAANLNVHILAHVPIYCRHMLHGVACSTPNHEWVVMMHARAYVPHAWFCQ